MKSLCRTCGETFGGLLGFEKHRVGEFNNKPPNYGRRCLSPWEMAEKGMVKSEKGVWIRAFSRPVADGDDRADAHTNDPLSGEGVAP